MITDIKSVEFDTDDKNSIIRTLTDLSVFIESKGSLLESGKSKDERKIAIAKFDVGVALLYTVDSKSPMLNFFQEKQSEWKEKQKEKNKNVEIVTYIAIWLGVMAFLFYITNKYDF